MVPPRLLSRTVASLAASAAFLLVGSLAAADAVDARIPLGGAGEGSVPPGGNPHVTGVLIPRGTTKAAIQVKTAKGSTLVPRVSLVHPDGSVVDQDDLAAAGAKVKASTKGVNIANIPELTQSGLYKVVVTGEPAEGGAPTEGAYLLKVKGKPAKGFKLPAETLANAAEEDDFPLAVPENGFLSLKLKPSKTTPFGPSLSILTPSGSPIPYDAFAKIGKDDSISVKNLPLPFAGDHVLRVGSQAGSGEYSLVVKVKGKKGGAAVPGTPVADAGGTQVVEPSSTVELDGTGTSGATGYLWTQVSGPPVALSSAAGSTASFPAPSGKATLAFQLVGTNAAGDSLPDLAIVEVDRTPVADGGPAAVVAVGTPVTLRGSGSFDPDPEDEIRFEWTQVSGPSATLSSRFEAEPTFTPATAGTYLFDLRVSDGTATSLPDRVVVVAGGGASAADAGRPVQVRLQDSVFLSGLRSRSGSGGAPSSWLWTRVDTEPVAVTLAGADGPVASFTAPKQRARLRFRLTVDGSGATADEVLVIVSPSLPVNASPVARAGATQSVGVDQSFTLDGSASSDDGAIEDFEWLQVTGTAVPSADDLDTATPDATSPSTDSLLRFLLVVHDGSKYGAPDAVAVRVGTPAVPVAGAGNNQSGSVGTPLTLSAAGSAPAPGETLTGYLWTQVSGRDWYDADAEDSGFDPTAASPVVTVPSNYSSLTPNRPVLFSLRVIDGSGTSLEDLITLNFTNLPTNASPEVSASASAAKVRPGTAVTLTAAGSDTDGDAVTYQWTQLSGPQVALANATQAVASFTAPTASGDMVFRVTVDDQTGEGNATATASTTVAVNQAPNVSVTSTPAAGPQGTEVTLDGTATHDPDDAYGTLSFQWSEVPPPVGSPVTLSGAGTDTATFTMPAYTGSVSQRTRTFRLTVTDSMGGAFSASATVTFVPNQAPALDAIIPSGGKRKFRYDGVDSATLSATPTTDADGDPLTFSWRIVSGPSTASSLLSGTSGTTVSIKVPKPTNTSPNTGGVYKIGVIASDGAVLSEEVTLEVLAMPSFQSDIYPILSSATCSTSGCHNNASTGGGLQLNSGASTVHGNLVGASGTSIVCSGTRVAKNDYQNSCLYSLVNNGTMPKAAPSLGAGQVAMFRDWIEPEYAESTKPGISAGAENN